LDLCLAHRWPSPEKRPNAAHPTAEWTGQQLREAFPFDPLPRYLLRDRDAIFGDEFREQVRGMGICEVLSAPRSPWQLITQYGVVTPNYAPSMNARVALRGQPNTGIPTTNLAALFCKERFIRFEQVALACPVIEPFESLEKSKVFHIFSNTYAE
jgi:hypothetical protein